jgi:hypothetical protein
VYRLNGVVVVAVINAKSDGAMQVNASISSGRQVLFKTVIGDFMIVKRRLFL